MNSRIKIDEIFGFASRASIVLFFSFLAVFSFVFWSRLSKERAEMRCSSEKGVPSYEEIGTGALSLKAPFFLQLLSNFSQEIQILARNTRPDAKGRDALLLMGIKSSKQKQRAGNGQTLFLSYEAQAKDASGTLHFSSEKTPLWIKPLILDRTSVLLEAGSGGDVSAAEERTQILLKDSVLEESGRRGDLEEEIPAFKALREARAWGNDLLILHYGGEEYKSAREKYKIEFVNGPLSYVCFVGAGDYLTWNNEQWEGVASLERASSELPLAHVKSCGPKGVEMEAWDETGFCSFTIKFDLQRPSRMGSKMENMPSSLRLRNSSQVTCVLGKRRVILKQGDWLLRTASGWRNLKTSEEIEACLSHRLQGELFIFDSLVKEQDRVELKGHLFDEMRLQMQEITLPISQEKKKRQRSQHGKTLFAKKRTLSILRAEAGKEGLNL